MTELKKLRIGHKNGREIECRNLKYAIFPVNILD